jgi:hypothetical protein
MLFLPCAADRGRLPSANDAVHVFLFFRCRRQDPFKASDPLSLGAVNI